MTTLTIREVRQLTTKELFHILDLTEPESFVNRGQINYYTFRLNDGTVIATAEFAGKWRDRWVESITPPEREAQT